MIVKPKKIKTIKKTKTKQCCYFPFFEEEKEKENYSTTSFVANFKKILSL